MAIKLTPWNQAFPDSDLDGPQNKCHMFANVAIEYLRACAAVSACIKSYGPGLHVQLPLMHQAIELLLKAHALRVDPGFSPRQYGHNTTSLIRDYESRVSVFRHIASSAESMALIKGLEEAWLAVRYADVVVQYTGPDFNAAGNIANLLADEYHRESGVALQAHHFKKPK